MCNTASSTSTTDDAVAYDNVLDDPVPNESTTDAGGAAASVFSHSICDDLNEMDEDWSKRNHFTKEQEEHLASSCKELFTRGVVMSYDTISRILKKTPLGRQIVRQFEFTKIKNKLNFLKYRKLRC